MQTLTVFHPGLGFGARLEHLAVADHSDLCGRRLLVDDGAFLVRYILPTTQNSSAASAGVTDRKDQCGTENFSSFLCPLDCSYG